MRDIEKRLDNRSHCIHETIEFYLNTIFEDLSSNLPGSRLDFFRSNLDNIKKAEKEYFENLDKWKSVYGLDATSRLDRHKVAALTGHYLLKHSPVTTILDKQELSSIGIVPFLNELCIFEVLLARLKNYGSPYDLSNDRLMGSSINSFINYKRNLNTFKSKELHEFVRTFVDDLSRDLYLIEKTQENKQELPT